MHVTPSTSKYANELHRRRILAGHKTTLKRSVAEISFLDSYGIVPTINDLHLVDNGILVASCDLSGRSFVLIDSENNTQWTVPVGLTYGVYVFIFSGGQEDYDILGWMGSDELVEAPSFEGSYVVTKQHFFPMPNQLDFIPPCNFPCNANAIWDWDSDSWECFACGKFRYNEKDREWWPTYLSKQGTEGPEGEKGN